MILIFSAFVGFILYGLFADSHPVLAWHLLGAAAILGGIWYGYDARINGGDYE